MSSSWSESELTELRDHIQALSVDHHRTVLKWLVQHQSEYAVDLTDSKRGTFVSLSDLPPPVLHALRDLVNICRSHLNAA